MKWKECQTNRESCAVFGCRSCRTYASRAHEATSVVEGANSANVKATRGARGAAEPTPDSRRVASREAVFYPEGRILSARVPVRIADGLDVRRMNGGSAP